MPLTSTRSVLLQPQASEGPKAASAVPIIKNRNKADHFSLCLPLRMSFSSVRDTADSTGSETILTHRSFLTVNGRKLRKMALPQTFDKPPEDIYAIKFLQLNNSKEIPTQKRSKLWVSSLSSVTWPPRVSFPVSHSHHLRLPLLHRPRCLLSSTCFSSFPFSFCPIL